MAISEFRVGQVFDPQITFSAYHRDEDVLKEKPWFYTIQMQWNVCKEGTYDTTGSITYTFREIEEVWDFANKMASVNSEIVDYVTGNHPEFVNQRIRNLDESNRAKVGVK